MSDKQHIFGALIYLEKYKNERHIERKEKGRVRERQIQREREREKEIE